MKIYMQKINFHFSIGFSSCFLTSKSKLVKTWKTNILINGISILQKNG